MASWFEKDEKRRFARIKMPAQVFIRPSQAIIEKQIFYYPVNYQPTAFIKKSKRLEAELKINIASIVEQKDLLENAFQDGILLAKLFGKLVQDISQGKNMAFTKKGMKKLEQISLGFLTNSNLKQNGSKSLHFFELINLKFIAYSKNLIQTLQRSNSTKLIFQDDLSKVFLIDKIMPKFKDKKYQQIALVKSLYLFSELINLYLASYWELLQEHSANQEPNKWHQSLIGISACGLDIKLNKDYALSTKLDIGLFFPETKTYLQLKGKLSRSVVTNKNEKQLNCIDFNFPDYKQQQAIENQQQIYQINRCFIGI